MKVSLEIGSLINDEQCYEQVRRLQWPKEIRCPHCESKAIMKRGKDDSEIHCQRYEYQNCTKRFDDLTSTVFSGHHQPLKIWVLCLYFMGLNLSDRQISQELNLNKDDTQRMVSQLRSGIGFWSLLRSWLRPHRDISQEKLPIYPGFLNICTIFESEGKPY